MKWNSYLEECVEKLQECNKYKTDLLAIQYVRLQQMAEKINSSPCFDDTNRLFGWKLSPPTLYIRALQAEIQTLKNDIKSQCSNNSKS